MTSHRHLFRLALVLCLLFPVLSGALPYSISGEFIEICAKSGLALQRIDGDLEEIKTQSDCPYCLHEEVLASGVIAHAPDLLWLTNDRAILNIEIFLIGKSGFQLHHARAPPLYV